MGHAHTYRIRVDSEGTSATEIESHFGLLTARISSGTGLPMHVVGQVIELADNARADGPEGDPKSPYVGAWYKGRLILAPELSAQGCLQEPDGGCAPKHVGVGDESVPAVHV